MLMPSIIKKLETEAYGKNGVVTLMRDGYLEKPLENAEVLAMCFKQVNFCLKDGHRLTTVEFSKLLTVINSILVYAPYIKWAYPYAMRLQFILLENIR